MFQDHSKLDPLLYPLFEARDEKEADRRFDILWETVLCRDVAYVLRRKGLGNDCLDDLLQETRTKIWLDLQARRLASNTQITNVRAFVRVIAERVYIDQCRKETPERRQLTETVQALLNLDSVFGKWSANGTTLCGPKQWLGRTLQATETYGELVEENYQGFLRDQLGNEAPIEVAEKDLRALNILMAHLFRWLQTPLPVSQLIYHLAQLLHIHRPRPLSLDGSPNAFSGLDLPDSGEDTLASLIREEVLRDIGNAIRSGLLSRFESMALLLRFRREFIVGNLELTMRETAEALGYSLDDPEQLEIFITAFWSALPLKSDKRIGALLGLTDLEEKSLQQKVSNYRMMAQRKLVKYFKTRWEQDEM